MKIPVRKGTFEISYIQCGDWRSNNLLSDGLSIEPGQEGSTAVITFILDTSINQKTRNKEGSSYVDSLALEQHMDKFQYLTISDDKVVGALTSKIKSLSSKVKCVLEIILNAEGSKQRIVIQPTVSNEIKLTKK
jgi:hypothetical protein